ncbi:MAG: hypothetical protein ACJART_001666 [Maribacter sp.]|jgi:hypothetical protein
MAFLMDYFLNSDSQGKATNSKTQLLAVFFNPIKIRLKISSHKKQ